MKSVGAGSEFMTFPELLFILHLDTSKFTAFSRDLNGIIIVEYVKGELCDYRITVVSGHGRTTSTTYVGIIVVCIDMMCYIDRLRE